MPFRQRVPVYPLVNSDSVDGKQRQIQLRQRTWTRLAVILAMVSFLYGIPWPIATLTRASLWNSP